MTEALGGRAEPVDDFLVFIGIGVRHAGAAELCDHQGSVNCRIYHDVNDIKSEPASPTTPARRSVGRYTMPLYAAAFALALLCLIALILNDFTRQDVYPAHLNAVIETVTLTFLIITGLGAVASIIAAVWTDRAR